MPQSAELIWARYDKQPPKHYLLIFLGETDQNILAMEADKVPDREVAILRANLNEVRQLSAVDLVEWIKKNMPISYTNAFRRFERDKLIIKQSYGLKSLKKTQ
jgi:hypothetical protein